MALELDFTHTDLGIFEWQDHFLETLPELNASSFDGIVDSAHDTNSVEALPELNACSSFNGIMSANNPTNFMETLPELNACSFHGIVDAHDTAKLQSPLSSCNQEDCDKEACRALPETLVQAAELTSEAKEPRNLLSKPQRKAPPKRGRRQPRIAIVIESKVDDVPDGYKWRKYGRKAVKNNPYPRNYFHCTSNTCSVKKRIQRFLDNPSMLILTYEGEHNHHSLPALCGVDFAYFAQPLHNSSSLHELQAPKPTTSPPLISEHQNPFDSR